MVDIDDKHEFVFILIGFTTLKSELLIKVPREIRSLQLSEKEIMY